MDKITNKDIFKSAFEDFQQTKLHDRLEQKFKPKAYYQKYGVLRLIALLASYLFNGFSAITASTLIYFFVYGLTSSWIISSAVTLVFIVFAELAKRKTSSVLFKEWLQFSRFSISLIGVALFLVILSITFSYFGSKQLVQSFHSAAPIVHTDTLTAPIESQIKNIDQQIKEALSTRWNGTTTTASQRTIEALTSQKLALQQRLLSIENRTDQTNTMVMENHQKEIYLKSEYFALITFLLEILFLLCTFYLEYYDYRSYTEFGVIINSDDYAKNLVDTKDYATSPPVKNDNNNNNNEILQENKPINGSHHTEHKIIIADTTEKAVIYQAIKQVKSRISTYKYKKRNGIGKAETADTNIEKWTKELERLETMV